MTVTRAQLDAATFAPGNHYNMGRAGYGYGYNCVQFARLSFIDRTFRPTREEPDGKSTRTFYVDGVEVADLDAAVVALNTPAILTDDEQRILALIPTEFTDLRELEDELAGVPHPDGAIMPNTPHSRVNAWIYALRQKGAVQLGRRQWAADYHPQLTLEHMRWSPTIRRVTSPETATKTQE